MKLGKINFRNLLGKKAGPEEYVDDLIGRFLSTENDEPQTGGVFDSSKTVSWKARREAEDLADRELIPILKDKILQEDNKKARDAGYFILGHIGKNTRDVSVAIFLIERQWLEQDRYLASAILERLAELPKPDGTDLTKLIEATRDSDWLIRHSAIRSLNNSEGPEAEWRLIEILGDDGDPYDVVYSNSVLNKIGTFRALPFLEKHLKSRKRDVKISAKLAIDEILKREAVVSGKE